MVATEIYGRTSELGRSERGWPERIIKKNWRTEENGVAQQVKRCNSAPGTGFKEQEGQQWRTSRSKARNKRLTAQRFAGIFNIGKGKHRGVDWAEIHMYWHVAAGGHGGLGTYSSPDPSLTMLGSMKTLVLVLVLVGTGSDWQVWFRARSSWTPEARNLWRVLIGNLARSGGVVDLLTGTTGSVILGLLGTSMVSTSQPYCVLCTFVHGGQSRGKVCQGCRTRMKRESSSDVQTARASELGSFQGSNLKAVRAPQWDIGSRDTKKPND